MKRQELKNLLRGIKPDGDISDIVDQIMELNGADIENAKKTAGTDSFRSKNFLRLMDKCPVTSTAEL